MRTLHGFFAKAAFTTAQREVLAFEFCRVSKHMMKNYRQLGNGQGRLSKGSAKLGAFLI